MGNLTHLERHQGFFRKDIVDAQLELVRRRYFNNGKLWFEYNEKNKAWEAKHKKDLVFHLFLGDEPAQLDFPYSRYGTWGDWARDLTIEALANLSNSFIWDDYDGGDEKREGNPEKYGAFNKYVARRAKSIPNCALRLLWRKLALLSIPKGVR